MVSNHAWADRPPAQVGSAVDEIEDGGRAVVLDEGIAA
jgi:hypothetical protein